MTISERKEREKEQRRKDILDAAERLFFSRGYDNVSMDDIAKAVELNKATIYLYFNDKESLFFAVVLRGVRILRNMVIERSGGTESGVDKLFAAGGAYLEFAEKRSDYLRLYDYFQSGRFDLGDMADMEAALNKYILSGFTSFRESEYTKEIIGIRREMLALMKEAIVAGIKEGDIKPDIDPMEAAVLFTLFLQGIQGIRPDLSAALEADGIDKERFMRDAQGLFYDMIRVKKVIRKK